MVMDNTQFFANPCPYVALGEMGGDVQHLHNILVRKDYNNNVIGFPAASHKL